MEYKNIAAQMIGVADYGILHWEFCTYLNDIARFAHSMKDCDFVSRQVIALAVVTWQRMNPDKNIIGNS